MPVLPCLATRWVRWEHLLLRMDFSIRLRLAEEPPLLRESLRSLAFRVLRFLFIFEESDFSLLQADVDDERPLHLLDRNWRLTVEICRS